ncbi:nucleotide sugar dehydrogenase [Metabacillus sp. Hm71]|uniref:nucleotide sugar dehydrogenase n=1 Tax=Metabacillus sp. Hm71 TaxID=3450743 RepID=UPI003F435966
MEHNTVAVVGLGKIGLPLAAVFSNNGFYVNGADINKKIVSLVNMGKSHITNEPGLNTLLEKAHQAKTLTATINTVDAVSKSKVVVVIVPVLIDDNNNVNYQFIDSAVYEIAKGIRKGTLVIFETTIPTGDTRNRFGKKIEEISGLKMGNDFYLAYSPERVYSNHILNNLKEYPKIVGGINERSLELASNFYAKALNCKVIKVSNLETAEFTKVAESVYRDVNIALANELAVYADQKGVSMLEVIKAGNSQPFSNLHYPGVGVGGHCIPVYPYFFINRGLANGLIFTARKINDSMSKYAVKLIEKEIGDIKKQNILILGLSFRENVKEVFKSSTLLLVDLIKQKEANIFINDPLYTNLEISSYGVTPLSLEDEMVKNIDIIILQAFHDEYRELKFENFSNCKLIIDGRNVLNKNEIEKLGIEYKGIGN